MARRRAYRAIRNLIRGSGRVKRAPNVPKKSFIRRNWKGVAGGLAATHTAVGSAAAYQSLAISSDLRNWSPSTNRAFKKQNEMIQQLSAEKFQRGIQDIAAGKYKTPKKRGR